MGRFSFRKRKPEAFEERDDELGRETLRQRSRIEQNERHAGRLENHVDFANEFMKLIRSERFLQPVKDDCIERSLFKSFAIALPIGFAERKVKRNAFKPGASAAFFVRSVRIRRDRDADIGFCERGCEACASELQRTGAGRNPFKKERREEMLRGGLLSEA